MQNLWIGAGMTVSGTPGIGVGQTYAVMFPHDVHKKPFWYRANVTSAGFSVAACTISFMLVKDLHRQEDMRRLKPYDFQVGLNSLAKVAFAKDVVALFPFLKNARHLIVEVVSGIERGYLKRAMSFMMTDGPNAMDSLVKIMNLQTAYRQFLEADGLAKVDGSIGTGYLNLVTAQLSYIKEFGTL